MAGSIKVNYILNLINTGTNVLLPLVTFPYASRILLSDGIGHVNFFYSIIQYIILFTSLGIPMYAIKEVAACRDDVKKMNTTVVEILSLHTLLTILGYIVVGILCFTVPQISKDLPIFLLLSLAIIFTTIGCEWFYQGIEDFEYITIRAVCIRLLSIVYLFLFVKTKQDTIFYALFMVFGVLGGNIFNFLRLRKYIHRENIDFKQLNITRHLRPVLKVFAFNVAVGVYIQLNTVILGFLQDDNAVGYYSASMKLNSAIVSMAGVLSNVMMPRLTNLIANNKQDEAKMLAQKSYNFSFMISLPLSIGLIFISPYLIPLFAGQSFVHSVSVSIIMAMSIFFIALSGVMGIQVLYPSGHIDIVVKCVILGCVADLLLCFALIPSFSYNGAAMAYLATEFVVTFSMVILGRRYLKLSLINKNHLKYILAVVVMSLILFFINKIQIGYLPKMLFMALIGMVAYFLCLYVVKEDVVIDFTHRIKEKIEKT